ncbi:hypothetical protein JNJ66_01175 [Candidatus Saccharibacteria bacterium]|nr:hypothetical protein [Candidatus Saccharibacteria bacterium]
MYVRSARTGGDDFWVPGECNARTRRNIRHLQDGYLADSNTACLVRMGLLCGSMVGAGAVLGGLFLDRAAAGSLVGLVMGIVVFYVSVVYLWLRPDNTMRAIRVSDVRFQLLRECGAPPLAQYGDDDDCRAIIGQYLEMTAELAHIYCGRPSRICVAEAETLLGMQARATAQLLVTHHLLHDADRKQEVVDR